jgi:cell division septal protein FtsQ
MQIKKINKIQDPLVELIAIKRQLRFYFVRAFLVLIIFLLAVIIFITNKNTTKIKKAYEAIDNSFETLKINIFNSIRQDLPLMNIDIIGNIHLQEKDIRNIINTMQIKHLSFSSMEKIVDKLRQLEIVENAYATRIIGYKRLTIHIKEREVIGLSCNSEGCNSLIDNKGKIFYYPNIENAQKKFVKVYDAIDTSSFPEIYSYMKNKNLLKKVSYFRIFPSGRYDIYFTNQLNIKLPRINWQKTLDYFTQLDNEFQLTENEISKIKYIDLRIPNKVFVGESDKE